LAALLLLVSPNDAHAAAKAATSWRVDIGGDGEVAGWTPLPATAAKTTTRTSPRFAEGATARALGNARSQRFLHPLLRYGVLLNGQLEVPLPPGEYVAWVLVGGLGQRWVSAVIDDADHALSVEGKMVRARPGRAAVARQVHRAFHRGWDRLYRPGDDPWALQITPLLQQHMTTVRVVDGALTITGRNLQLRALAVESVARRKVLQAQLIRVWQGLADHFARVADPREAPPAFPGRAPLAAERDSALQLWRQPVMVPMTTGSRPPARGEPQPSPVVLPTGGRALVVVGVRALRALKSPRVTVRVMRGARVAPVKWRLRRLAYNWRVDGELGPSHLLPVSPDDASAGLGDRLDPGLARALWIDLQTVDHGHDGRAELQVDLSAGDSSTTLRVPILLRPWPLVAAHDAGHFVLQNARPSALASHGRHLFGDAWEQGRAAVYRHLGGLGLLPQVSEVDGRVVDISGPQAAVRLRARDRARFVADIEHHRRVFPGVPVTVTMHWTISGRRFAIDRVRGAPSMVQPEAFYRAMRLYLESMEAIRRDHPQWPPLRYVIAAEPGNRYAAGIAYGRRILQAVRPVGVRVIACLVTPSAVDALRPLADIIATNVGVPGDDPALSDLPDGAAERWIYQGAHRLDTGFLAARVGATGGFREFYQQGHGRAFNNFDGDEAAKGAMALPIPGDVVSTPRLERMALGVVDLRVIQTLRRMSRQARGSSKPRIRERGERALEVLADVLSRVEIDTWRQRNVFGRWAPEAWGHALARLYAEIDALHGLDKRRP